MIRDWLLSLFLWFVLQEVTGCKYPLLAYENRNGVMAPSLNSGDMLFNTNYPNDTIKVGDIVVVKLPRSMEYDAKYENQLRRIVEVHKTLKDHEGNPCYLMRIDNELADGIFGKPHWVFKSLIVGKMTMNLPLLGVPILLLKADIPHLVFFRAVLLTSSNGRIIIEMIKRYAGYM
ncbi:SEC11A [Branchiostoma lanceolatum]|nr:SEC11A [Branchiostoma lanceolatum]